MKQLFIGLVLTLALSACKESAETAKPANTERFPGFTQVGADDGSAKLYLDLNSIKQEENLVHLKLVRVLDAGYVIQDAITDCTSSFKALEGVQYRDDGTSDKKYAGDAQPLPFASKPDIAALVKKACDKAGVVQQVATPAPEKPKPDGKAKAAESVLPEETPDKLQTRAGLLEIAHSDFNSPPDSLVLNGKVVFKEEGFYLSVYQLFSFSDHDAVLFSSNCGGSGCPANDFAFLVVRQGTEPKVIKVDGFDAYPSEVKTKQEGNAVKLNLGFSAGKRKLATLEGEQLTIRLEDVAPQALDETQCKWLHTDAMPACVEARTTNPDCADPQGTFAGVIMRGVAATSDYPGFVHSGFDQQCQQACQTGKAADYAAFGSAVCSKPGSPPAPSTPLQPEKDRLNAAYKTLFEALPVEKQGQLEVEQKAWLAARDSECGKLTDETSAADAVGIAACILKAVTKRADELAKIPVPANANKSADNTGDLPSFKEGDSYSGIRKKLLDAGWQPYHSPDADACSAGDSRCESYPEMEACAGTGLGNCRFLWKHKDKTLAIFTIGDGDPSFSGMEDVKPQPQPEKSSGQGEWYKSTAKPVLVVRSEPSVTGEKVGTVPEGGKVKVIEKGIKADSISGRSGSWVKIEWQDGVGYAFDAFLERI